MKTCIFPLIFLLVICFTLSLFMKAKEGLTPSSSATRPPRSTSATSSTATNITQQSSSAQSSSAPSIATRPPRSSSISSSVQSIATRPPRSTSVSSSVKSSPSTSSPATSPAPSPAPSNSNTTSPMNTPVLTSIPANTLAPMNDSNQNYGIWDSKYLYDRTNTTYDKYVDELILKKGDSASAYMNNHKPDPKYKGIDNTIAENESLLDYFIHLFKTYSEPFTSKIVLTDTSNNKMYDLSSNYEIFRKDNKIQVGKHDETNYDKLLKDMNTKYEDLKRQKPPTCNEEIKCIADFGTNIGDDLCCDQPGVLKDTRYVCPVNAPTCGDFKCGSKFGKCS